MGPLILLHVLVALAALPLGKRLGRHVFLVSGLAPLATFVWAITQASAVTNSHPQGATGSQ